jgi:SulP family sulfate permease
MATVADGVIGDSHDSNTELIAQGIANMIVSIFGGIPVTGAIARTMTNVNNGGRTPVAGIIHAFVLLFILQFLGGLTKHIPMACLAGILFIVSYNMSDWRTFKALLKSPKSDVAVLISTFLLTVIFNLTIAIEVGLLLAVLLFLRRISETTNIAIFKNEVSQSVYVEGTTDNEKLILPKGVEVYEIEGPFFFGIANKFEETMKQIGDSPKIRIIRMRKVPFIDSTGLHNLENLIKLSSRDKIQLLLSGVNENVYDVLNKAGVVEKLGEENVCRNINIALQRAQKIVGS